MSICACVSASADDNASGEDFSWGDDANVETISDEPYKISGSTVIPNNTSVFIYDLAGKLIASTDSAITLPRGFYILKTINSSIKIYIK